MRFRYFALVVVGLGGAGVYLGGENNKRDAEESRQREALARAWSQSAIRLEDLKFSGVHLKERSYGPYMALDGVVANNAKYTLDSFDVQITLKDCEDKTKETNCRIVGQASGTASPAVPSGQTRSFGSSTCSLTICRGMSRCSVLASRAIADASSTGVLRRLGPRNSLGSLSAGVCGAA